MRFLFYTELPTHHTLIIFQKQKMFYFLLSRDTKRALAK